MKQPPASSTIHCLRDASIRADVILGDETLCALADMVDWLAPAASTLGLTKYASPCEAAERLIGPVLPLLSADLVAHVHSPLLDFGAGCGAIGLSIAVMISHIEVVLADRRARVVQFLDLALRRSHVRNGRAQLLDLSRPDPEQRGYFGSVAIRAYGPATEALSQALPWLAAGGTIILWHQPPSPTPLDDLDWVSTVPTAVDSLALSIYRKR